MDISTIRCKILRLTATFSLWTLDIPSCHKQHGSCLVTFLYKISGRSFYRAGLGRAGCGPTLRGVRFWVRWGWMGVCERTMGRAGAARPLGPSVGLVSFSQVIDGVVMWWLMPCRRSRPRCLVLCRCVFDWANPYFRRKKKVKADDASGDDSRYIHCLPLVVLSPAKNETV